MIKTIIFDFGNVIGFFSHRLASGRLAYYAGVSAETMHRFLFGGGIEDDIDAGKTSVAELLHKVRDKFTIRCDDEFLELALADMFWPNREVCDLIPRLKPRYRLLLGSNTNELHTRRFKKQFAETLSHFDALVLSYEIQICKPEARFFEHCQQLAQAEPGECLFIDDMPANIAGAQAFGWNGILYQNYSDLVGRMEALEIVPDKNTDL
ncbi:MAG TPA: HAD family phosphatase [Gemmataceae bacterium]|jgi:putative hydrolase of the HAD superfamily|nr:HAD family phosphatase [Gemmataceae bacterium]